MINKTNEALSYFEFMPPSDTLPVNIGNYLLARFKIKLKAKGRPRFNTNSGKVYTPADTKAFEQELGWLFKKHFKCDPIDGLFLLRINFFISKKSMFKKHPNIYVRSGSHKPDIDNLGKSVLDALNGIVYKDDVQVVRLEMAKNFVNEDFDYIEIGIYKIEEVESDN